jgi:16S rRNA (cytosine967-C5)-methyltransferase
MAHSDDALNSTGMSALEPRDRNLVTEITYGTIRWRGWLDFILEGVISRPWDNVDPRSRLLLRLSLYQMARMDRIPDHAIINEAVELAKIRLRPGAARFINGVLRHLARSRPWLDPAFHRDAPPWIRASLPRWLWERWQVRYGIDRAFEYAISLNQQPRAAYRVPCGSLSASQLAGARALADSGVGHASPSELVPGAFLLEPGGRLPAPGVRLQDEASQLIPHLFGPIDGAAVWDVCAAPGGKSAILLELCGASGRMVCSDLKVQRAVRMQEMLRSSGSGFAILIADARKPAPFLTGFDAVLADVPCSGLGTLRRNPEVKWRFKEASLPNLSRRQYQILESAARVVRPGGLLIYSTCSTEPEENEGVVDKFLRSHPAFHIRKPATPEGIEAWLDGQGMFHSCPSARLWDGFFAALMVHAS